MTFSDEPGIYLRGEFGVRLEDDMVHHRGRREALHAAVRVAGKAVRGQPNGLTVRRSLKAPRLQLELNSGLVLSLTVVTSDQIFGKFTFSIDFGWRSACARNAGQIEIRLEADVNGERRDRALDAREERVRAEEVVQENDPSARTADAPHLLRDLAPDPGTTLIRYGA